MASQKKFVAIVGSRWFGRAALKVSPLVGFTLVFRLMMLVVVPSSSVHCTITCSPCSNPRVRLDFCFCTVHVAVAACVYPCAVSVLHRLGGSLMWKWIRSKINSDDGDDDDDTNHH